MDKNISRRLSHNFLEFKFEDKDTCLTTFVLVIEVCKIEMRLEFVVPGLEEIRGAQEIYYEILCVFIMRRRIKLSACPRGLELSSLA